MKIIAFEYIVAYLTTETSFAKSIPQKKNTKNTNAWTAAIIGPFCHIIIIGFNKIRHALLKEAKIRGRTMGAMCVLSSLDIMYEIIPS